MPVYLDGVKIISGDRRPSGRASCRSPRTAKEPSIVQARASGRRSYHHGALRHALLDAALALLAERGLDGLSLRACTERLGVSHAAHAHHFPTLKALLTALAGIGFERFAAAMAGARAAAQADDPLAQLQATMDGYVGFATGHAELFRLMFSPTLIDFANPALRTAAAAAYAELAAVSAPIRERFTGAAGFDQRQTERFLWALTHGYAQLAIQRQIPWTGDMAQFREEIGDLSALLRGLAPP